MTDAEFRAWARDVRPDVAGLPLAKLRVAILTVLECADAAEAKLAEAELELTTERAAVLTLRGLNREAESREKALREGVARVVEAHRQFCAMKTPMGPAWVHHLEKLDRELDGLAALAAGEEKS